MRKRFLIGAVAACTAMALQVQAAAQQAGGGRGQGGGRGGQNAAYPTAEQYANSKEAQAHVAKAKAIAGNDAGLVARFENTCGPMGPQRPALERQAVGQPPAEDMMIPPTKLFENVYYIGFNDVGAWAITTSDGIILIDSLNTVQEGEEVLAAGLTKVGLNPANVKYVIVGHGHADHFGGASFFQDKYRARVALSAVDWDLIERPNPNANPANANRPRPRRDHIVTDGQKITVGDTSVTLYLTPGHTPGTLAYIFPVKDKGRTINALLLSGANQTPNPESLKAFERVMDAAKEAKVQVLLNGHPGLFGDELGWMEQIRKNPNGPNPYVYGEARFARFLDLMKECARSRIAAMAYKSS